LLGAPSFAHVVPIAGLFVNTRFEKPPLPPHVMDGIILIAINSDDIASANQASFLLKKDIWVALDNVEGHAAYKYEHVRLWFLDEGILRQDSLEKRWTAATNEQVIEVIFPSRHSAKSGTPCLTLHPIGVPHLNHDEIPEFGGESGYAPPPSTRLGPWWRLLKAKWSKDPLPDFSLSLEVTHHGPVLDVPCLFIEVGSTQDYWGHEGAAELLSDVIWEGLGLTGEGQHGRWDSKKHHLHPVLITLGGGHYAPKGNKLASEEGVWLGHMLANHSIPFGTSEDPGVLWRQSIDAIIQSTQKAFPGGSVTATVEKKSFKGWQRQLIYQHLESISIPVMRSKPFLEMVKGRQQDQ
jgi:D-aminoacyl-tRNA deacylase